MLNSSSYPAWDMKAIVQQLVGKQIAKKKLPTWFQNNESLSNSFINGTMFL